MPPPSILNSYFALRVQIGMKMCVGLFTFIVGYGGYYAKKTDRHYISSHVWRTLKQYWIVLAMTLLVIIIHESSFKCIVGQSEFGRILYNMVGLNPYYNLGNWYIYFYIYALCIIPLLRRLLLNRVWVKTLILTVCCGIASYSIPADMLLFKVLLMTEIIKEFIELNIDDIEDANWDNVIESFYENCSELWFTADENFKIKHVDRINELFYFAHVPALLSALYW